MSCSACQKNQNNTNFDQRFAWRLFNSFDSFTANSSINVEIYENMIKLVNKSSICYPKKQGTKFSRRESMCCAEHNMQKCLLKNSFIICHHLLIVTIIRGIQSGEMSVLRAVFSGVTQNNWTKRDKNIPSFSFSIVQKNVEKMLYIMRNDTSTYCYTWDCTYL